MSNEMQTDLEAAEKEPGSFAARIFTNADHVQLSRQGGTWTLKEDEHHRFEYASSSEISLVRSRAAFKITSLEAELAQLKIKLEKASFALSLPNKSAVMLTCDKFKSGVAVGIPVNVFEELIKAYEESEKALSTLSPGEEKEGVKT
jgi:hypothetical protein